MVLTYYGLSCFKIKHGDTVLITDPYDSKEVGLKLPKLQADMVLYSQGYDLVNAGARKKVEVSDARKEAGKDLLEIYEPGEYEVGDIYVRKYGRANVSAITIDDISIYYAGMAREFEGSGKFDDLGTIDYLVVPVGDATKFMDWKQVDKLIKEIDPGVVIPSCYKLDGMSGDYGKLRDVDEFLKDAGVGDVSREKKIKLQNVGGVEESQYKIVVLDPRM